MSRGANVRSRQPTLLLRLCHSQHHAPADDRRLKLTDHSASALQRRLASLQIFLNANESAELQHQMQ